MLVATLLALGSALLHAAWNLLVKTAGDRGLAAWGQFAAGGLLALPVLAIVGWPDAPAYPFLIASALVHVAYVTGLAAAYTHGDFSLAYPLARGGGALLAALGGALLLGDVLGLGQWVAIAVVGGGLLSLVGKGATRASVAWALFTAATIATYTLIDAEGARSSTSAVSYGFALMVFAGAAITVANVVRGRTPDLVAVARSQGGRWVVGGAAIAVAYTMVLVAITMAPVGYVTMLRESSVVLGALAGWLFLHERMGRHRVVSSCVIAAGLVLLIALSA